MSNENKDLSKEQHMINFVKSFVAIEEAMEPFKDQRRDLRESYNTNSWLSKEEMRLAVKAYRLLKQDTDIQELADCFKQLKRAVGHTNV